MGKIVLAKRIQQLTPSPTLALDSQVKQLQAQGISIINLTLGEPDFETPIHIKKAAIQALKNGHTHYTSSAGILELRKAITEKLKKENNISYDASEIVVGVGTKNILYNVLQVVCQQGDEVILPTPCWATYIEQIKLAGAKPSLVQLESPFKLKATDIAKKLLAKQK